MLKPKVKKGLVFRKEAEGAFLFNPEDGAIKVLNLSAAVFWKLLDGKNTLQQVAQIAARHFSGVKIEKVSKDLKEFICELEKSDLLV